jgi:hypothetical protein
VEPISGHWLAARLKNTKNVRRPVVVFEGVLTSLTNLNTTMTILPNKPSKMIRAVLKDLIACENDPRIAIEMHQWVAKRVVCEVCFAGAAIIQRLKLPEPNSTNLMGHKFWFPEAFPKFYRKLHALNYFQQGNIIQALEKLGLEQTLKKKRWIEKWQSEHPVYNLDPEKFKESMRTLAGHLEKAGL